MKLFTVLSRENGLILNTDNLTLAEETKKQQEMSEEMSGCRPSVYIVTSDLNKTKTVKYLHNK